MSYKGFDIQPIVGNEYGKFKIFRNNKEICTCEGISDCLEFINEIINDYV